MSVVAASVVLAGAVAVQRACKWSDPGADRYMGNVPAAVDHYADIPPAIRDRLKERLQAHAYEDIVTVTADAIRGQRDYEPGIEDMHFGRNRVCRQVSRKGWPANRQVLGLVYCEQGYCVMVPTVCGNLSRINRRPDEIDITPAAGPAPSARPVPPTAVAATPLAPQALLAEAPPSVGLPAAQLPPVVQVGQTVQYVFPPWPYPYPPGVWPWPYLPPIVTLPPPVAPPPAVPEPSVVVLAIAGAAAVARWAARRRTAPSRA